MLVEAVVPFAPSGRAQATILGKVVERRIFTDGKDERSESRVVECVGYTLITTTISGLCPLPIYAIAGCVIFCSASP
jgi:hypothetical protein